MALLFNEVRRDKERMNNIKYHQDIQATAACTERITKSTKEIGHKYTKGATKDCFIFSSWFFSKKAAKASMKVGAKLLVR